MMEKTAVPYDTISVTSVSSQLLFTKCCFCIPLRVGCFILGYINLIVNFFRAMFYFGLTVYCAFQTHGFDHADSHPTGIHDDTNSLALDVNLEAMDPRTIKILGFSLILITVFDLIWLAINIACLVGIHKKKPGPIRVYVGFATFRLILTLIGYMYHYSSVQGGSPRIIAHCIDLVITVYFISVYYIYAVRLEKAAREEVQVQVNDIAYIYPTKLDKEYLVV